MKKTIIYILFCQMALPLLGQTNDQLNHDRYWYYRHRLRWDFMRDAQMGSSTSFGYFMPAGERGFEGAHNKLKGGDGTIELGWYIATLATEYKLLVNSHANDQEIDVTLVDLFNAINTFNRLDYYAETYYKDVNGDPGAASLNGFFVRDDIKNDAFLGGPTDPLRVGVTSRFQMAHVEFGLSSAMALGNEPRAGGGDQIWYLLMGFKMVKEYIPTSAVYPYPITVQFMDGETKIVQEVQNIVDRIFDQLQLHNWQIVNPVTGDNVPNGDGGDVHAFCFAAATVADQISPDHIHQNLYSANTGLGFWETLGHEGIPLQTPCVPGLQTTDSDKFLLLAELGDTWLPNTIGGWAADDDYEYIPLIGQLLWNSPNVITQPRYEEIFNDAPCDGPYHYYDWSSSVVSVDHYPDNEWSSRSRFVHPETRHDYACAPYPADFEGEYNGLDYMFFHNLYYLQHDAVDLRNQAQSVIHGSYPFLGTHATLANPDVIVGYEKIGVQSILVNPGADLTLHAGYMIHISGSSFHGGANFHAYVQPFTCATTLDHYRMEDTPADSTTEVNPVTYTAYMQSLNKPLESSELVVTPAIISGQTSIPINSNTLHVFPNPSVSGFFEIDFLTPEFETAKISVLNTLGLIVKSDNLTEEFYDLNIEGQPKGIYIVKIECSKGVFTKKIVYQ